MSHNNKHKLNILQINLQHKKTAALQLQQTIIEKDIDIALIQEPYVYINKMRYIPHGYQAIHHKGNTIIIKSSIPHFFLQNLSNEHQTFIQTQVIKDLKNSQILFTQF